MAGLRWNDIGSCVPPSGSGTYSERINFPFLIPHSIHRKYILDKNTYNFVFGGGLYGPLIFYPALSTPAHFIHARFTRDIIVWHGNRSPIIDSHSLCQTISTQPHIFLSSLWRGHVLGRHLCKVLGRDFAG